MTVPQSLESLPSGLLARIRERALDCEPGAEAILVCGSYATNTADEFSDLDLTVLFLATPSVGYRTWFERRQEIPLHVSAGFEHIDEWFSDASKPARWSFGFPTDVRARLLWATEGARNILPNPPNVHQPASGPELEDFVEAAVKMKRCTALDDELGLRLNAHVMASLAPRLLIPMNPERRVRDPREALDAALSLSMAPPNFSADLAVCLGLDPQPLRIFEASAMRLCRDLLGFLQQRCPDVDPQPWIANYLRDGTLLSLLDGAPDKDLA